MRHRRLWGLLLLCGGATHPAAAQGLERTAPDQVRDSIASAMRQALRAEHRVATTAEGRAVAWATRYARAWGDDFLLQRVRWLFLLDSHGRRAWLLADSLRRLGNEELYRAGPARALALWRRARELFRAVRDSVGANQTLGNLGAGYFEQELLDSAEVFLTRALRVGERLGDRRTAANALTILGDIARQRGQLRTAMETSLRAAALHRAAGDWAGSAGDHNNAGLVAEALGDWAAAEDHFRQALATGERAGGARMADYQVNLGALAVQRGRLDQARTHYRDALRRFHADGETLNEALVRRNLGSAEAAAGESQAAEAEYRAAIALVAGEDPRGEADALRLLASLHGAMGRFDEALAEVARASDLARRLDPPDRSLLAAVSTVRGDLELGLNQTSDARASFEEAEQAARAAGDAASVAAAAQGQAQIDLRLRRYDQVRSRLGPIASSQQPGRDRAWSRLLLGAASEASGDSAAAMAFLNLAVTEFDRTGDRLGASLTLGTLGLAHARQHRPEGARRLFEMGRRRARGLPTIQWWLLFEAGRAREAVGDISAAAAAYDSAITAVEVLGAGIRIDDRRARFLEDKWAPYIARAGLWARWGDASAAFAVSERLRARYLLDLLTRGRSPASAASAWRAEERELHARMDYLATRVAATGAVHRSVGNRAEPRTLEALLAAQTAYRQLLDRIRAGESAHLGRLRGEPASPEQVRHALSPEDLLLEYLVGPDRVLILAVSRAGVTQFTTEVSEEALRTQIDFARWAIGRRHERPALWRGALRALHQTLLSPVQDAGLLGRYSRLLIVPHRELHYLPFEALIDTAGGSDRYLVESHEVVYLPSASLWLQGTSRPRGVAHGVLALAPYDRELPGTSKEIQAVGAAWGPAADLRRGPGATEETLAAAQGRYRIVHLATRGVLSRRNPMFSHVLLRPGPTSDGRLEVHEVLRLDLPTDLLVLTACESGLGAGSVADVPGGDDWIGLVQAFLQAGARQVLATLWAVSDESTADLAAAFHRRVARGVPVALALAEAKRESIRRPGSTPFDWAGLVLTGIA